MMVVYLAFAFYKCFKNRSVITFWGRRGLNETDLALMNYYEQMNVHTKYLQKVMKSLLVIICFYG